MQKNVTFIAMSFKPEFTSVYEEVYKKVCEKMGYIAYRADQYQISSVPMTGSMIEKMKNCSFFIADISHNSPNVYYEIGYLQSLGKKGIFVSQLRDNPPHYIFDHFVIRYEPGLDNLKKFIKKLKKEIEAINI